jgi:hypothetical protein
LGLRAWLSGRGGSRGKSRRILGSRPALVKLARPCLRKTRKMKELRSRV